MNDNLAYPLVFFCMITIDTLFILKENELSALLNTSEKHIFLTEKKILNWKTQQKFYN